MQNLSVRRHFGIHFFTFWYTLLLSVYICLIQQLIGFIFGMHVPYRTRLIQSKNVFGDAALINYANLCKFSQNHINAPIS